MILDVVILNNPEYLNEENLSKINFSTVVIDKDNNEKIVECKSIDMVNNFKKIVLESLMKNLNDDKNFKRDFIKTYGEEGINKLATLANNLGALKDKEKNIGAANIQTKEKATLPKGTDSLSFSLIVNKDETLLNRKESIDISNN